MRCPYCGGETEDPQECDSCGEIVADLDLDPIEEDADESE
jgi:methionyl-tRNA synthetase